jgi:dienelactone hydrolase
MDQTLDRREFCQLLAGTALAASAARPAQSAQVRAVETQEQRDALELLLRVLKPSRPPETGRINAVDRTWEDWQKRTGELPPKFSALPSQPFLPDVLAGVQDDADWLRRKTEIRAQIEQWLIGKMPPAPDNLRAAVTSERRENTVLVRDVRLEFGPEHRGVLRLQLLIPPCRPPLPVFLTNHNRWRPWAATAVARGYMGVIYFAADPIYGFEDDSDKFIELYPDCDFSCLGRWAWAASRAVDYLHTLPEVDRRCIAISGHSRNGKQAVIAAALDERITAVVPSSGNTGEGNPWRYTSDPYATESIEQITSSFPHWFHPRLRFFAGREDKLPFDQNSVLALIAPRSLLLSSSYTESQGSNFGFEQNFRALQKVYNHLGVPNRVGLHFRAGYHATTAGDIEAYVDFLDAVFGRASRPAPSSNVVFGYSFENWKRASGEAAPSSPAGDKLAWALGVEPPQVSFPPDYGSHVLTAPGWMELLYQPVKGQKMRSIHVPFGVDLRADLYLPLQYSGKLPLVVWLHPFTYATGYAGDAQGPLEELTRRGYAVLTFDQIGFGTRVEHAREFYRRYPKWSLLGKMIADTRAAISAGASLQMIHQARIFLVGYSLGAKAALWTAAHDRRPAGIVAIAGITPLRTSKETEGIRAYSHLHGLLPRLGYYVDRPETLPVDYDDVFQRIQNQRVLLIAPRHDRYADVEALKDMVRPFKNIEMQIPGDFNRLSYPIQKLAFDWIDKM